MGLDEAIDAYLDQLATERGLARHTIDAYARDLAAFARFLVARRVRKASGVGTALVRAHLAALADRGLSPRSRARALAAIHGFLRFLTMRGVLRADPAAELGVRRPPSRLPRALGAGPVAALLAQPAEQAPRGLRDRALLELLYATGLRVSELVALDLPDVDLRSRQLRALGKGRKERIVPFGEKAAEALRSWLPDRRKLVDSVGERTMQRRHVRRCLAHL